MEIAEESTISLPFSSLWRIADVLYRLARTCGSGSDNTVTSPIPETSKDFIRLCVFIGHTFLLASQVKVVTFRCQCRLDRRRQDEEMEKQKRQRVGHQGHRGQWAYDSQKGHTEGVFTKLVTVKTDMMFTVMVYWIHRLSSQKHVGFLYRSCVRAAYYSL